MLWWPHNMDAPLIFGQKYQQLSSLSMNGCGGDPRAPLGLLETRTFAPAPTPSAAADRLNSAIYDLKTSSPPPSDSGIIRIEVSLLLDLTFNFSSSTIVYRAEHAEMRGEFQFFCGYLPRGWLWEDSRLSNLDPYPTFGIKILGLVEILHVQQRCEDQILG